MNYVVNLLVGEAETAVKGLTLGSQNYVIARDLLSERFGDNQTLAFSFGLYDEIIFFKPNF